MFLICWLHPEHAIASDAKFHNELRLVTPQ